MKKGSNKVSNRARKGEIKKGGKKKSSKKSAGKNQASHHLHKNPKALVISVIGAFLALFAFSWIYGSNYTGYVNVDINTVHFDETAFDGTRLVISSLDGQPIPMGAARITGRLYGDGKARVYLVSGEQRFLVYSNTKEEEVFWQGGEPIGEIARTYTLDSSSFSFADEPERALQLEVIEGQVQEGISKDEPVYIRSACLETCRLHNKIDNSLYVFVFEMGPDVMLEVTDIGFS